VHRHSGSLTVEIDVASDAEMVSLTVKDAGRGIPAQVLERFRETGIAGIGLGGIRERVADLGGELWVQSDGTGTLLPARIPMRAEASKAGSASFAA